MNLFPLDSDLTKCAEYTVDTHCIKQILESSQVLSNCYPQDIALYKHTHKNHPITLWLQESLSNFNWTIEYALALGREYTFRYNKEHKSIKVVEYYRNFQPKIKDIGPTKMPRCFGEYKGIIPETDSVVEDYRQYYKLAKSHLFSWKNRQVPIWLLK